MTSNPAMDHPTIAEAFVVFVSFRRYQSSLTKPIINRTVPTGAQNTARTSDNPVNPVATSATNTMSRGTTPNA